MENERPIDIKPDVETGERERGDAEKKRVEERMQKPATSYRDLGTVGGGPVPGASSKRDAGSTGGPLKSDSTVEGSGSTDQGYAGSGLPRERGGVEGTDLNRTDPAPNARNTVDRQAQRNVGGRDPGQPQTSMGDRDARSKRSGCSDDARRDFQDTAVDPMSARDPHMTHTTYDQTEEAR